MPQNSTKFISVSFEEVFWDMLPSVKELSYIIRIVHTITIIWNQ